VTKKKEDGKEGNDKVEVKLDTSQFEEMFNNLASSFGQSLSQLSEKVDAFGAMVEDIKKSPTKKAADDDDATLPNLEVMDRKQFMGAIVDQVSKKISTLIDSSIDDKIKPLSDRLKVSDDEAEEIAKAQAAEEYGELKDNPMWKGLLPNMQELFKQNPSLSPKQLLALAKADNPEKVKEIEEANPDLKEKGDDKKETTDESGFGGLLPTSTLPGATVEKMDGDQASEKAWSKVFGAKEKVTA
jgi:hypothetical protein